MTDSTFPKGTRIGESYAVMRLLGEGGSGQVYLCRDEWLDRHVAIKLFHRGDDVAAYEAELDALVALNHPNVLSVFDRGVHRDGRNYIVTAYIAGPSLRDILVSEGELGFAETYRLLRELASGLEALHQRGIVHGDIKPENILLRPTHDANYSPVIIDFGFSAAQDSRPEQVAASPAYVAPERLVGGAMGPGIDNYALALIAYELLTDQAPMARDDLAGTIHAHLSQQRPKLPPRQSDMPWPDGLEAVLQAGMALDPEKRPSSATAFVQGLHRVLDPHLVDVVSARCPSCARANVQAGDFCSDCGVRALPTRCPSCGNATDPCFSSRCLGCDKSLLSPRPPRRSTSQRLVARLGSRAVLVALGEALDHVEVRFALETELRRSGGQLLAELGPQVIAVFERTRGVPSAAHRAIQVADAVWRRTSEKLEGDASTLVLAVECGDDGGGPLGVAHGKLDLGYEAARVAVRLAWGAHQRGDGGVWLGERALRLLPPGSSTQRVDGNFRLLSLGNASLRLRYDTEDHVRRALQARAASGAAAVVLRASDTATRRAAVMQFTQRWAEEHSAGQLFVPGRGHQYRPLGLVKSLLQDVLKDLPEEIDRARRIADVLVQAGDTRERARADAQLVLRSLSATGDALEGDLVEGGLSAILWRVLDGMVPARLILSIEEASYLSHYEVTQLLRMVDRRGDGSCLVFGCEAPKQEGLLRRRFEVIDVEIRLEDGGFADVTDALPSLRQIPELAQTLPRLTGGDVAAAREFFTLAAYVATKEKDVSRLTDLVTALAADRSALRAAHLARLSVDEARCLRVIAAVGQDAIYNVVATLLSDIDVAGCVEALAGMGFVDIDYGRYDGDEIAVSLRDRGLEAWIRDEYADEAVQSRRAVRDICLAGHGQLSVDLSCRFARLVADDGDNVEAARLLHQAAVVSRFHDPWLALKILRNAADLLEAPAARASLLGRSLSLEVALLEVQLAASYADPEWVLVRCDELHRHALDVVEHAQIDRSRAIALRRLGWSIEAIPVLEGVLRVLAQHEHEEWAFADLCETLAELHFENDGLEDTRRVVRLYFAATGAGPFVAGPQSRVSALGGAATASIYDASTDTFGTVEQVAERRLQRANMRMRLLLAQASLGLGENDQAERELRAVQDALPGLSGTTLDCDAEYVSAVLAHARGRTTDAHAAARRAARGYWRLGMEDEATVVLLWALDTLEADEATRRTLIQCVSELDPQRPEVQRRARAFSRPGRKSGRWFAVTSPPRPPSSRSTPLPLPVSRSNP